jgi:hypothetical protein
MILSFHATKYLFTPKRWRRRSPCGRALMCIFLNICQTQQQIQQAGAFLGCVGGPTFRQELHGEITLLLQPVHGARVERLALAALFERARDASEGLIQVMVEANTLLSESCGNAVRASSDLARACLGQSSHRDIREQAGFQCVTPTRYLDSVTWRRLAMRVWKRVRGVDRKYPGWAPSISAN